MLSSRALRARLLAGALLPAVLLLSSCQSGDAAPGAEQSQQATPSAGGSPSEGSPSETPSESEVPAENLYVALGDSFVSAPLVPTTDMSTGCLRSSNNFPNQVIDELGDYDLVDVSCSGATSTSMIGVQITGDTQQLPQFDSLTPEVDLVTLGIGGNDFNLFSSLMFTCLQAAQQDPTGAPCKEANQAGNGDELLESARKIQDRVEAITLGIKDRAPNARVIVVNYPQFVPSKGTCPARLPLAAGDYPYVLSINKALSDAVTTGGEAAGADVIDAYTASLGHDICSAEPWVNGIETQANAALALHPFLAEQTAVADLILEIL
ncbi:SGNH/GDSL hydrolase family protein [Nocardioides psychrotolerans]|uniref:GDSL-like Lipase/Acylhydrolase family protein n=1 Tax=Nocardioides psychrotolerans TaxID=1005945 RepID=A0A1I3E930_9ACTN|nr:SGNH/GDSL hydrolase family protein [Nocardioides psychrotolerans]SFH95465.1 GDSL-like Lipase/Acylhydrolase family protein [Nocardioides psychrotolerans]